MKTKLLELLCCPETGQSLKLVTGYIWTLVVKSPNEFIFKKRQS